jgi:deoxyribodipyrimidine photo-lyase
MPGARVRDTDSPIILWFRQDLRLADNPALAAAVKSGRPLLPIFILDDATPGRWAIGGAGRWWLAGSLDALRTALAERGARLVLRRGEASELLEEVIAETGAGAVYWNRCYEPAAIARDRTIKSRLTGRGITVESFNAALLHEPWTIRTGQDQPFKVFTPFRRALLRMGAPAAPSRPPDRLTGFSGTVKSDDPKAWRLRPIAPDWAGEFAQQWKPGEAGACRRLDEFLDTSAGYGSLRDRPDRAGTSRLSPHLHWGEIGPRTVWHSVEARRLTGDLPEADATAFLRELAWREFSHHLLFHWPDLPEQPWRPEFAAFAWRRDTALLAAWQQGRTGYPIVDAAMRELWRNGWIHNRLRMIVASFLIKHLLQPWQDGEAWFWDTLVDADLAQNAASWQWVAGCGADAAPYFRIFNPVLQGERFDPQGAYVRRWLPVLDRLPARFVHCPWRAPETTLAEARLRLGTDYPLRIVDHETARGQALAAFEAMRAET